MSALGPQRISRVELAWPRYGTAWARVSTELGTVPFGPAALTIGDLTMQGSVVDGRAGENAPSAWSGIWVNGAGWDTVIKVRPAYQNDDGVRLKTVLKDLAADCGGMALTMPADVALGPYWTRPKFNGDGSRRTGRDELNALVSALAVLPWWVDLEGVTKFGGRTFGEVAAVARVKNRDLTIGMRLLSVDSPAAFVPGGTFESARMGRVVIRESDEANYMVETWVR